MINFDFEYNCSGCSACFNICSVNAIEMKSNSVGFLFPVLNEEKCIKCGKCETVCPHLNKTQYIGNKRNIKGVWLYSSKNEKAKIRSSSGGACYELGLSIIKAGGYICGCAWNEELKAMHIIGNDERTLESIQGSKYLQSDIGSSYKDIYALLEADKKVIFTGTPCQATAMHNFVMNNSNGKYRDQLIIIAVICHGVASPMVWESYKKWILKKTGSHLIKVNFRDKTKRGYKQSYCRYELQNGTVYYQPTFLPSSKYIEATIIYNLAIRNSCSRCDCKGIITSTDLIIGDWYAAYKGEGCLGTSCIVAATDRGQQFALKNLSGLKDFFYEDIRKKNNMVEKSISPAANRDKFFENISDYNYWDRVEELYPPKYKYKKLIVKMGLYGAIKKIIG